MNKQDVKLGMSVTFRKYGAQQVGLVTAKRSRETVQVTEYMNGEGSEPKTTREGTTRFLVEYTLRNGNRSQDWMQAPQFEAHEFESEKAPVDAS
jgi:hypothetical protein